MSHFYRLMKVFCDISTFYFIFRYLEKNLSEPELEKAEEERADRCLFVRDLIFGSLSEPQGDLNEKLISLLNEAGRSSTDVFMKGFASSSNQDEVDTSISVGSVKPLNKESTGSSLGNDPQCKQIQDEHGISESFQTATN